MAAEGLIRVRSRLEAAATLDRLEAEVSARGMTVFARIDHAAGAHAADLSLRPTALLIFGNAKGGTSLMQADQEIGLDLPLKVLVYQDSDGQVWLAWNDMDRLARQHHLPPALAPNISAMKAMLAAVTDAAAQAR